MTSSYDPNIVILDDYDSKDSRTLAEIVEGSGFKVAQAKNLDSFYTSIKTLRVDLAVIAFECLWPEFRALQEFIEKIREVSAKTKLVVVYNESSGRLNLGNRLWNMGVWSHFISRSESPFRFKGVLRQLKYDSYVLKRLDSSPHELSDSSVVLKLGPKLLQGRSIHDLLRTLSLDLPLIAPTAAVAVLIFEEGEPKVHTLQFVPVEHESLWRLYESCCEEASYFSDSKIDLNRVEFLPTVSNILAHEKSLKTLTLGNCESISLMNNGKLIGSIGVLTTQSQDNPRQFSSGLLPSLSLPLCASMNNIRLIQEIENASLTDELTGAYNRRFLKSFIEREISRAHRYQLDFVVAVLDLDYFKKFNDKYGHLMGDAVLKEFATLLISQIRAMDRLIRYGGEEFLLVLLETDMAGAAIVMERIRSKLLSESLPVIKKEGSAPITFSAGIASYRSLESEDLSSTVLIERADQALYQAKKNGRNQICVSDFYETSSASTDSATESLRVRRTGRRLSFRKGYSMTVKYFELPHYSSHAVESIGIDIGAAGISIMDVEQRLRKNSHVILFLADHQDPVLCRVAWIKDTEKGERRAGLEIVKARFSQALLPNKIEPRKSVRFSMGKALIFCDEKALSEKISRILAASHYKVVLFDRNEAELTPEFLQEFSLLVVGQSIFRKEFGIQFQKFQRQTKRPGKIIVINESHDRNEAVKDIQMSKIEHLVSSDEGAMETLFAGLNKMMMGEIFGLKKYLLWGAESKVWPIENPRQKSSALDEIKKYALSVKCHPRVADLLVMAVDEMLIKALFSTPSSKDILNSNLVTLECGSDGRFLLVSVTDERGSLTSEDVYQSLGKAMETAETGVQSSSKGANLGFKIMLSTLSQLSINISPGKCTEIIGIVDLRKTLKEYRKSAPSFGLFSKKR